MRRIWLTRHGETEWNACGKLQGHTDIPLNDTGRQQAAALAARFASMQPATKIESVWSSDLRRAQQTGAIVAAALQLAEPLIDHELRERSFGVFEGLTRDECSTHYPEAWQAWQATAASPPGGEDLELVAARMQRAIGRIFAAAPDGEAMVVSHGGAMRLWLRTVISDPIPLIRNGAAYLVERRADGTFTAQLTEAEGEVHVPGPQDEIVPQR
jgi:broad specificity phosphatase PhoE